MNPAVISTVRREAGFTLLELLVVLVIIGILLSLAALSIGGSDDKQVKEEAQRLVALLELAEQESVLKSKELLLLVEQDGYSFMVADADELLPVEESGLLRPRQLPEGLRFSAIVEGQAMMENLRGETEAAQVWILSSGELTPFEITLRSEDGPAFQLKGELTGAITLSPVEVL